MGISLGTSDCCCNITCKIKKREIIQNVLFESFFSSLKALTSKVIVARRGCTTVVFVLVRSRFFRLCDTRRRGSRWRFFLSGRSSHPETESTGDRVRIGKRLGVRHCSRSISLDHDNVSFCITVLAQKLRMVPLRRRKPFRKAGNKNIERTFSIRMQNFVRWCEWWNIIYCH